MSSSNFGYCAGNLADAKAQKNGYSMSALDWWRSSGRGMRGFVCTKVNGNEK